MIAIKIFLSQRDEKEKCAYLSTHFIAPHTQRNKRELHTKYIHGDSYNKRQMKTMPEENKKMHEQTEKSP